MESSMVKINTVLSRDNDYCRVVLKIHKFCSENLYQEGQISPDFFEYETSNERFYFNHVTVYIKDGYISIIFKAENMYPKTIEMTCVVAIIDDHENKRFTQSFGFCWNRSDSPVTTEDQWPEFVIEKYIAQKHLLKEPTELLPNDILTINIEIQFTELYEVEYVYDVHNNFVKTCFKTEEHSDGAKYFLFLDSLVAERLREESRYFKRILVTPMEEKRTRYMCIPTEEYQTFLEVGCILLGANSLRFESINDIYRLYAFADKYDVLCLINICRSLVKVCLTTTNVSEISDFASVYNDDKLKEIVKHFLQTCERSFETTKDENGFCAEEKGNDWFCENIENSSLSLHFRQRMTTIDEKSDFDFYH